MTATSSPDRPQDQPLHPISIQSADDLINKVKMQRLLGAEDRQLLPALRGHGHLQRRVLLHLRDRRVRNPLPRRISSSGLCQDNDLTVDGDMTDPKGDRSKAPHDQADPDMYVHVVGAAPTASWSAAPSATRPAPSTPTGISFMPTIAMGRRTKIMLCPSPAPPTPRASTRSTAASPATPARWRRLHRRMSNAKFGGQEALVVLDHVFIPNEYIFLSSEYEFAGTIVERAS